MAKWKLHMSEVFKLINSYKGHECLWNYRCSGYKRSDLKRNAWRQLAEEFNRDVNDVKAKIKHLRSSYVAEKKKVDESQRCDTSEDPPYVPHLFYYDELNFLNSLIVLRTPVANLKFENNVVETEEVEEEEEFITTKMDSPYSAPTVEFDSAFCAVTGETDSYCVEDVLEPQPSPSASISSAANPLRNPAKKRRRASSPSKFDEAVTKIVKHATEVQEETIYSSFGRTMALQLTQLTPIEAVSAMDQLHSLLTKLVMRSMLSRNKRKS